MSYKNLLRLISVSTTYKKLYIYKYLKYYTCKLCYWISREIPWILRYLIGRICDDEDEYDSDMNDFIDDGPEENGDEDYSKYISEIFGYDKSKYRQVDDDDDAAMESTYAQQLKEEFVSTKIGKHFYI